MAQEDFSQISLEVRLDKWKNFRNSSYYWRLVGSYPLNKYGDLHFFFPHIFETNWTPVFPPPFPQKKSLCSFLFFPSPGCKNSPQRRRGKKKKKKGTGRHNPKFRQNNTRGSHPTEKKDLAQWSRPMLCGYQNLRLSYRVYTPLPDGG